MIIFTDLDGTLLNHHDYAFFEAKPALDRIKQSRTPLIIVTSKTRREVEPLRKAMGIDDPFIVENGGGIFFPAGYRDFDIKNALKTDGYDLLQLGLPYALIRQFFDKIRFAFEAKGFGDMTAREISRLTGLSEEQANIAKDREFTEPFIMGTGHEPQVLSALAEKEGMAITRGGRFYHLIGKDQDKGRAVCRVRDIFQQHTGEKFVTVGLGDSENDRPFLEQVDIPILIPHPVRGYLDMNRPGLLRAKTPGSHGWNTVMEGLLDEYAISGA
ncbi:MAG: HAD-IIB family hydrolase [Desulfobacteraceae bacterium]|nr:MAG: HAD-IIB family hydrolase [Desulfobacteraceae bacterium]